MRAFKFNVPTMHVAPPSSFADYLSQQSYDPFALSLQGMSLMEVVKAYGEYKRRVNPSYYQAMSSLTHNLAAVEQSYGIELQTYQVTGMFWSYFLPFCETRGLKDTTIHKISKQLCMVLTWAAKYGAVVAPSYSDFKLRPSKPTAIALSAEDVNRITYFDIERYYAKSRKSDREKMGRVRDMFVLSCNLFQRYSDMVRIEPSCFDRNLFKITSQKTGIQAIVDIDKYAISPKTVYRLVDKYGGYAPYTAHISNYDRHLKMLMRDIGFTEEIRTESRIDGKVVSTNIPKWQMISSHTARRTAITVNVVKGVNMHSIKRCSGHASLDILDRYIKDEEGSC